MGKRGKTGEHMRGRKNTPFLLGHKRVADFRRGKTYKEIYGDKAESWRKRVQSSNKKNINRFKDEILLRKIKTSLNKIAKNRKGKTYKDIYGDKAEEQRLLRKISIVKHYDKIGRKNDLRPRQGNTWEYTDWRNKVFQRDNWTCQTCRNRGYVQSHHIKEWSKFPEDRFNVNNGVTLCIECHKLVHRRTNGKEK